VPAHRAEWEQWRAERLKSLRREDGWLTLVGLFWLEEGENAFGTDPSNRIVFPPGRALARMGSILVEKGTVAVRVDPRIEVTHEGRFVTQMTLATDAGGEKPTVLKHGSLSFYVIERGKRLGVRVKDAEAPARTSFRDIETFPYDERYRIPARFEPYDPPRVIAVPNVLGGVDSEKSAGSLVFQWQGKTYRLDPLAEAGETDLFVIFGDATNGEETYGGGRFLYAKPPSDGKTILDFNRAYNPPCVFTPYATCPLPPKQNRLPIRIEAGEKNYEH
jgi:uncharacterized protein (DUF1684 family)